jgi:5-methylcytosine-specific restriction endonuclease McrA
MGNVLPRSSTKLAGLIAATEPVDVSALSEFIDQRPSTPSRAVAFERRPIPDQVRAAVLVRDGGRCRRCGSARNLEVDHIVPLSKGDNSEEPNLQTLCRRCNRRKWKKLVARI